MTKVKFDKNTNVKEHETNASAVHWHSQRRVDGRQNLSKGDFHKCNKGCEMSPGRALALHNVWSDIG